MKFISAWQKVIHEIADEFVEVPYHTIRKTILHFFSNIKEHMMFYRPIVVHTTHIDYMPDIHTYVDKYWQLRKNKDKDEMSLSLYRMFVRSLLDYFEGYYFYYMVRNLNYYYGLHLGDAAYKVEVMLRDIIKVFDLAVEDQNKMLNIIKIHTATMSYMLHDAKIIRYDRIPSKVKRKFFIYENTGIS